MTGTTIQHYRIGERLGAGGMGEVYRAEDTRLGRQVALKFVSAAATDDPDMRSRLMTEARAASALQSPHVAVTYDLGEHEGAIFIVMEYVDGELLSERLRRGLLAVGQAIDIGMQVADALDEAHSRGIVHRDIKSSNLILTERDLVKVLDFGLAKFVRPLDPDWERTRLTERQTAAGLVLGTLSYMSPEQVLGRPVDHRSDLFSLGIVLYEMLAGRLPFEGGSVTEIADKIIHHQPEALARFNYGLPIDLEGVVRKALEKDAGLRYQSARELYVDLRKIRRDLEAAASRAAAGRAAPEPALANTVAVMTFSNITREPSDDWIGTGIAETVTADLKTVDGLSVIGRERIFEVLKNLGSASRHQVDDRLSIDIGRQLAATWIISGGYQRLGEQIRITARFVEVQTGAAVKTVKIDGRISEIFDLQDRIVYELSQGLNLKLGHWEIAEIERDETQSVEAYEDYSRGIMNLRMASPESLDRAIYLFEKAIEHDPRYSAAWAALGDAYELKADFLSMPELLQKAIDCERRAIEINPRLANAHRRLGAAYISSGRYDEAIAAIKEALRLDPGSAGAHSTLARAYWIGKGMLQEGIAELERSVEINPDEGYSFLQLGLLYAIRGDYARAEAACRQAIELQERYLSGREGLLIIGAHTRLGYVYYRQGRYDEAIREYERELAFLTSSDHALRDRAMIELNQKLFAAYLRKGNRQEAERYRERAVKAFEQRVARGADDPFTKYYAAVLYALAGDGGRATKYLSESHAKLPALAAVRARLDPDFDAIRDEIEKVIEADVAKEEGSTKEKGERTNESRSGKAD